MAGILDGIRVLDWTMWYVGPEGAALLGDLGAEVIHIEEREKGDQLRGIHRFLGIPLGLPAGRHVLFEHHDRNKKGLAIDLKKPEGREVLYRLVEKSDVFVTNFRRTAARRAGLDYETLSRHNPRLIYASSSCFGHRGPDGNTPGLDLVAYARSGIMMACGPSGQEEPTWISSGIGDEIGGVMLAFGIISALLARERYGFGQEVTTSQLTGLMKLQALSVIVNLFKEVDIPRQDRTRANNPLYNWYKCSDGKWLALGLLREREWEQFCSAVGKSEWATDPRFTTYHGRESHCQELIALFDQLFATRTREEWCDLCRKADLIHSPVNTIADLPTDPQVVENKYITDYDHPVLGKIKFIGHPVDFSRTPMALRQPAPDFGQHTEEVLTDLLGYSWEDIARLKDAEVI